MTVTSKGFKVGPYRLYSNSIRVEAYTPAQLQHGTGGPPVVAMMMQAQELEQELTGMQTQHCEELEREIIEGIGHKGTGAVVQYIGIKA